jgi:Trk K+ transport system NAD-binding subunit
VPLAVLGRLLASSAFEPAVAAFIADATTARGSVDLVEVEAPGETVEAVEGRLNVRAVAIVRGGSIEPAEPNKRLEPGDKLVVLRRVEG